MEFGFTIKPEHSIERTLALTRQAEAAGFAHGWLFDSHVLWREPYVLLTLMAQATTTLRLGTCVTNPATREPTVTASSLAVLHELSRAAGWTSGIGRGDSARRVLGKQPTSMAALEEAVHVIRGARGGRLDRVRGRLPGAAVGRLATGFPSGSPATAPGAQADRPDRGRGHAPARPTRT
jgi:alkanesulfonate monooxygenase SsuD/methylene tetrahydromethanopterin reductase-like flavin-dependent oxidoreductase (luciferase family)